MTDALAFPRQSARTQRFTLGTPRTFTISPDGRRIVFLRSRSGTDTVNLMWVRDTDTGVDTILVDPAQLLRDRVESESVQERALRERAREGATGIVRYTTDSAVTVAAFVLSGRLFVADLISGAIEEQQPPGPVMDPRLSPDGRLLAYVSGREMRVRAVDGTSDRAVIDPEDEHLQYGLAEFIAAEEMGRDRGFWWAPDGSRLLVARVDDRPVDRWWIADPRNPEREPAAVAYPAAGTANAEVTLVLVDTDGRRTPVEWDRLAFPYLARVQWAEGNPPLLLVQARDQKTQRHLTVDVATGATTVVGEDTDQVWVELFSGVPAFTPDGRLVRVVDSDDARVLMVGTEQVTGSELQVRGVLAVDDDSVLLTAMATGPGEIGEVHVYRVSGDEVVRLSDAPGVHSAVRGGEIVILLSSSLASHATTVRVLRGGTMIGEIESLAATPALTARPELRSIGARRIPAAVLLPATYSGGELLPVLLDPYGGPHGQRVVHDQRAYLEAQWLADNGFAVVIADGRGTAGQDPRGQKAVSGDLAGTLDDQVDVLNELAAQFPLDLTRVAIRGWSFGGYLAALAVLRRPDVFHAAVAGAPVTDWRLYDTHYTERYLGHPDQHPDVYDANSLVTAAGLSKAALPARPLLLIHGLVDDNVVVAHTLRLSAELLAAGRPHEVLPLSGVTHRPVEEQVAENLLLHQVDFLRRALTEPVSSS
ncbi:S9 family peptidase [Nocardia australiensis]|uniref:S9 family peptidase n=1 Tax=Nocardia australiensis TaxID=2887191 RepID=UPI001D13D5AB|nr:S9 family peptidase [Nocardia australiensis]